MQQPSIRRPSSSFTDPTRPSLVRRKDEPVVVKLPAAKGKGVSFATALRRHLGTSNAAMRSRSTVEAGGVCDCEELLTGP